MSHLASLPVIAEGATVCGGIIAVGGVALGAAKFWVRHELRQLRPNGGSHLADKINDTALLVERIDAKLDGVVVSVGKLEGRLDEHTRAHF